WDLSINVTRTILLENFGTLIYNDTYIIINNDDVDLPFFRFALPNQLAEKSLSMKARSNWANRSLSYNTTEISLEYTDDDYSYYIMPLAPAITNSSKYLINVQISLFNSYTVSNYVTDITLPYQGEEITLEDALLNGIKFNTTFMPLLSQPIQRCNTRFEVVEDGGIIEELVQPTSASKSNLAIDYGTKKNIPAYNFSKPYNINDPDNPYRIRIGTFLKVKGPAQITRYHRKITVENWYWAKIEETITIKHYGVYPDYETWDLYNPTGFSCAINDFSLEIRDATKVEVYDQIGSLEAPRGNDVYNEETKKKVNVYLRVPIFGGDERTIHIDYLLKLEDILQFEKSEFILSLKSNPKTDLSIQELQMEVILPQGSSFQYVNKNGGGVAYTQGKTGVFLKVGRRDKLSININNIASNENAAMVFGYYMNDLAYFIQPLVFSIIIFIACLLYIGVRTLRKDVIEKVVVKPTKEEIPIELIQSFVELYEEKTALQLRITKLDNERRRKKIKAKEYDKQRKILESKMRKIISELNKTKQALKSKGRKYSQIINRIEVSEEKRLIIERNIRDLRIRYIREKALSKDAYLKILRDYKNQIEKFERNIDKEIINLRLLIEHEQ
ncbi:MAG: hypothetical protein U9O98_09620, partial [Asgard group archaeon]|nr:hypothetical protein [Asgard group archaeon]